MSANTHYVTNLDSWKDDQNRLMYDCCATHVSRNQREKPGHITLATPGYRRCETQNQYSHQMSEPYHQHKQYRSACYVNDETTLQHANPTNQRYIHQLASRPYLGQFQGAGQPCPYQMKDTESMLMTGFTTTDFRPCEHHTEATLNRFEHLPNYGNPQRVQHVVEPWTRGGNHTRDYVRQAKCGHRTHPPIISDQ